MERPSGARQICTRCRLMATERIVAVEPSWVLRAECPCPALAVVDLRLVVCCALCAVTCAVCWACVVCRGVEPPRLPPARQA